jgi:hypothetical protein
MCYTQPSRRWWTSVTEPIEKSKGFEYALVSYHEDREALAQYQASAEHERYVTSLKVSVREGDMRDRES